MEREFKFYLFAAASLVAGLFIAIWRGSVTVALISLVFAVGSSVWGRRYQLELAEKQKVIQTLVEDKSDIESQLRGEKERKEQIREEKLRKNQRLSNLKQALRRKGIDTDYLIEKYDSTLKAPIMVLTHFSAPNNNSEEDEKVIKSNLDALDSKMLHGSARIIPPRNFDQSISTKKELQTWFDQEVLGGRTDIAHKLEAISVVDVGQTFDRDASVDNDGPDFKTNTVSSLFETDTVIPTDELLDLLSRSEQISLEEELRENAALLAVQSASQDQMEQIIQNQSDIEEGLGDVQQIRNTSTSEIERVLAQAEVPTPEELGQSIRDEAKRLCDALAQAN